jgi:DNA-binding MarR family transcriptional regulator
VSDLQGLFSNIVRLEIELWDAVDARLKAECDVPLSTFEPMRTVAQLGPCRVYDIASELVITVGGTSKIVDRLEVAGLCRRRSNPDDRRSSLIELTPAGTRLLRRATAVFDDELQRRLGAVLPARVLQQLGDSLARLRSAMAEDAATERTF